LFVRHSGWLNLVSECVCEALRKVYGMFYNVSIVCLYIVDALYCDYH